MNKPVDFTENAIPTDLQPLEFKKPNARRVAAVLPAPSPTAQLLQHMDAEAIIRELKLVPMMCESIVQEWKEGRDMSGIAKAQSRSIEQYIYSYRLLLKKYTKEHGLEDESDMNPIDFVKRFFNDTRPLAPATWKRYRQSILYVFNKTIEDYLVRGYPVTSYLVALAALITVSRQPYQGYKKDGVGRVKSIRTKYFDMIINQLATGYIKRNHLVIYTQSFAIATFTTGLRPSEWASASFRQAKDKDMPEGLSPKGWMVLELLTGKRKDDEPDWPRHLLIPPGVNQAHIGQHLDWFQEAGRKSEGKPLPYNEYIRNCSKMLKKACVTLWPKHEERWITLYSLRSQARANIAKLHGQFVAAAMLGHSVNKSTSYYAGSKRANLPRGRSNGITTGIEYGWAVPGPQIMEKAREFEADASGQADNHSEQVAETADFEP
jgi:hypothetical protein